MAGVPAEAIRGGRHLDGRLSPHFHTWSDVPLAHRGPRTLRGHHAERPPADHGVLARPDSARHVLLQAQGHRRHHQRELRRRMDRRHHRAIRLRHGTRLDLARRPAGAPEALPRIGRRQTGGLRGRRPPRPGPRGTAGGCLAREADGQPSAAVSPEAARCSTTNSWDRTQIPQPFATVSIAMGAPFEVPRDAQDDGIEAARLELEARLRALEARARQMASGT